MKKHSFLAALALGLLAVLPAGLAMAAPNTDEVSMKTVEMPLEEIAPYGHNPRRNEAAIDVVMDSIKNFGFLQPLVVDAKGVVIVGHTRLEAAKRLGMATVPTIVADLPDAKAKEYRIADNRTGEEADWDYDLLRSELRELELEGSVLTSTGFSETELDRLMKVFDTEQEPGGKSAVLEDGVRAEAGDVWELGGHQLRVGRNCLSECDAMITGWQEATGKTAKLVKSRKPLVASREA